MDCERGRKGGSTRETKRLSRETQNDHRVRKRATVRRANVAVAASCPPTVWKWTFLLLVKKAGHAMFLQMNANEEEGPWESREERKGRTKNATTAYSPAQNEI